MIIKTSVDFIDACDLLKCQLSRVLAIVSASQQCALKSDGTLSTPELHELAAGLYERDMENAMVGLKDTYRVWRQTGGQD